MNHLIRKAEARDMDDLVSLCAEHAEYEGAPFTSEGKADLLASFLFAPQPRFHCLVVERIDGTLLGYATFMEEFSTWDAALYLHMDCLFLRPQARSHGIGAELIKEMTRWASVRNITHMQWQTPITNTRAIAFYYRLGATSREKLRMYLDADAISHLAQ